MRKNKGISTNQIVLIVAAIVVVGLIAYYFGKSSTQNALNKDGTETQTEDTQTTSTSNTVTPKPAMKVVAPTPSKPTVATLRSLTSVTKGTKCEMSTTGTGGVSIIYTTLSSKGNIRVEKDTGSVQAFYIYTPTASYTWDNRMYKLIEGSQAVSAVNAILNTPMTGFSCGDKVVDDNTFARPNF